MVQDGVRLEGKGSQPRTELSPPACAFPHVVKIGGAKHAKPVHRLEAAWLVQAIPASSMALTHQCQVHGCQRSIGGPLSCLPVFCHS
jgi:hypothetical protein